MVNKINLFMGWREGIAAEAISRKVSLRDAELSNTNFTMEDLSKANLEGADLRGSNFYGAIRDFESSGVDAKYLRLLPFFIEVFAGTN